MELNGKILMLYTSPGAERVGRFMIICQENYNNYVEGQLQGITPGGVTRIIVLYTCATRECEKTVVFLG